MNATMRCSVFIPESLTFHSLVPTHPEHVIEPTKCLLVYCIVVFKELSSKISLLLRDLNHCYWGGHCCCPLCGVQSFSKDMEFTELPNRLRSWEIPVDSMWNAKAVSVRKSIIHNIFLLFSLLQWVHPFLVLSWIVSKVMWSNWSSDLDLFWSC